ncbi:MAG: Asp-tRNA(Asn)/Glu-tRNA(Gln) amidotransferase subunit GatC [Kiritimatiellae bacterium]|nr:Asp-tRNA(Asn)/Glu-tRNA(Gln) amidotransferase subunit GatC [Kiritimatiellia bacterium]
MSQSIDVAYVSELARIALTDDETKLFQGQLETIVDYVEKINGLDLDNIKPTMHGQVSTNFFRDDVVSPSLDREAVLDNAPARTDSEFKLPKIVEDA